MVAYNIQINRQTGMLIAIYFLLLNISYSEMGTSIDEIANSRMM